MKSSCIGDFKYSIIMFVVVIILFIIGVTREEHYVLVKKAVEISLQVIGIS